MNESLRQLWTDLAELILAGIAWDKMEAHLYEKFGHVNEHGKPYYPCQMYRLIMKPIFWSHNARHHNSAKSKNGYKGGDWVFDAAVRIPEGALIYRNTHPSVWTGDLAEEIKAELYRRSESVRGNANPENTHRFSGLAVCGECGSFLSTYVNKGYRALLCPAACRKTRKLLPCNNRKVVNEKKVIAQMHEYLNQMLLYSSADVFNATDDNQAVAQNRLQMIEKEIEQIKNQARQMVKQQAKAGSELSMIYEDELNHLSDRLRHLKNVHAELHSQSLSNMQQQRVESTTLEELSALSLEAFWNQKSRYINQVLHRLMGKRRLVTLQGEVIGVATVNRPQRNHA